MISKILYAILLVSAFSSGASSAATAGAGAGSAPKAAEIGVLSQTANFLRGYRRWMITRKADAEIYGPTEDSDMPTDKFFLANFYCPEPGEKSLSPEARAHLINTSKTFYKAIVQAEQATDPRTRTLYHGVRYMRLYYDVLTLLEGGQPHGPDGTTILRSAAALKEAKRQGLQVSTVDEFLRMVSKTNPDLKKFGRIFQDPSPAMEYLRVSRGEPKKTLEDSPIWNDHVNEVSFSIMSTNLSLFDGMAEGELGFKFFLKSFNMVENCSDEALLALGLSEEQLGKVLRLAGKYPMVAGHGMMKIDLDQRIVDAVVYLSLPGGFPICQPTWLRARRAYEHNDWSIRFKDTAKFLAEYRENPFEAIAKHKDNYMLYYNSYPDLNIFASETREGYLQARLLVTSPLLQYGKNIRITMFNHPFVTSEDVDAYYKELEEIVRPSVGKA